MTVTLNEDVLTIIYSHTFDFEVLRNTVAAIISYGHHPIRNVVLSRLLQLRFRLSIHDSDVSKALIDHFVRNSVRANLVRDIAITLGPSRKSISDRIHYGGEYIPEQFVLVEKADELVRLLPQLLRHTENLHRLDWSNFPLLSEETLKELSEHSVIAHLSLDCAVPSSFFPHSPGPSPDAESLKLVFSSIGLKTKSLNLRNVDEDAFKIIIQDLPPLKNIRKLKLDLTCGVWDWDGGGSPPLGPSERYKFPPISDHVQELDIIITDLLARQRKGPIELANPKHLTKLRVEVTPCFSWMSIDFVRLFSDINAADFSSLTRLIIDDTVRDLRRWTLGGTTGPSDWREDGRTYVGIHKLINSLPQLRHLWVNERVLAIPSSGDHDDDDDDDATWHTKAFGGDIQDTIMSRTVTSPQWELLGCVFERLESLRVGFGPLNASWATKVLSQCDHTKLKAFGFDWDWQLDSNKPDTFSELIATLSKFKSLTDLHILHPYPTLQYPIDYSYYEEIQSAVRRLHNNEETVELAKKFLSELPGLYRVGIGRNSVWERQTRWKEDGTDGFIVQKLYNAIVPSFYDAGSSLPDADFEDYDETPAMKDVLKLLEKL